MKPQAISKCTRSIVVLASTLLTVSPSDSFSASCAKDVAALSPLSVDKLIAEFTRIFRARYPHKYYELDIQKVNVSTTEPPEESMAALLGNKPLVKGQARHRNFQRSEPLIYKFLEGEAALTAPSLRELFRAYPPRAPAIFFGGFHGWPMVAIDPPRPQLQDDLKPLIERLPPGARVYFAERGFSEPGSAAGKTFSMAEQVLMVVMSPPNPQSPADGVIFRFNLWSGKAEGVTH